MPFIALAKTGQEEWKRVDITKHLYPKNDLRDHELKCHACGSPMYIRHTLMVQAHFAHKSNQVRDCAYNHVGETDSHRAAKREIAEGLKSHYAYKGATVEYEVHLKEVGRIADVMVTYPDGVKEIHEAQLAQISTEDLEARTQDYQKLGYDVVWWLGKNADTETNRHWEKTNYGYLATISLSESWQPVDISPRI